MKEIHTLNTDNLESKKSFFSRLRFFIFKKTHIWEFLDLFPYRWRMFYYDKIKPIFDPKNERIRKSIPKTWMDIGTLIETVNFEMIKSFYEEEFLLDDVDWDADEQHKNFADWLKKAYKYVSEVRPQLENDAINSYPPLESIDKMFQPITDEHGRKMYQMIDDGVPYEKKYAEVNRLEKLIEDNDTEILTQLIKFRKYLWT